MAGLAIAVGTWASIMIMVNFLFGIIIFKEPVHDILGTMASFLLLIVGLVGMSHYSAPKKKAFLTPSSSYEFEEQLTAPLEDPLGDAHKEGATVNEQQNSNDSVHYILFGVSLNQRQCGILGAAMNGVFTGGSLIPLHYAKKEGFGGANYIISMASGAFMANTLLWACFFFYQMLAYRAQPREALQAMPRWHWKELWFPGFMAGLLLSVAMFGSILAVTYLGQGVGNSLVQTKILVSGLWGIFFYKEISGAKTIGMWFLSASIAVLAIIWLSLERLFAASTGH